MAQLTTLDEKVAEVLGLAMAAQVATEKVVKLVDDDQVAAKVRQMHDDAAKVEQLGTELVDGDEYSARKTAILDKARETKREATDMMQTYLGDDADGLDGFEFLTMAEAGELGHWKVVNTLVRQQNGSGHRKLRELVDFVLPKEEQHLQMALDGTVRLAQEEDPDAPA